MTLDQGIANDDWAVLHHAVNLLENPSLAARLTSLVGSPIEEAVNLLPSSWQERISTTSQRVTARSLDVAVSTLNLDQPGRSAPLRHRHLAMLTGAAGGYFGLPGTLVELPFTTMLILRSVAGIAADEGEDLHELDCRLACLEVFALGGRARADDAAETGYYGLRMALAFHFSALSEQVVRQGVAAQTLPASINLVRAVAARFGVAISDKAALQMVPVIGALGGAVLNAVFVDHFQDMARGHFAVRRLERKYGSDAIEQSYASIARRAREAGNTMRDADAPTVRSV